MPMGLTSVHKRFMMLFMTTIKKRHSFTGHSFTGNPLGCAVALASLELFDTENTLNKVAQITAWNKKAVAALQHSKSFENVAALGTVLRFEIKTKESTNYLNTVKQRCMDYFKERNILIRPLQCTLLPPTLLYNRNRT